MQLSPLAVACLERDAWKKVENISRQGRNRRIHAFAVKRVAAFSDIIARIAEQEVSDFEMKELEKAKKIEEFIKGDGEEMDEDSPMLRAVIEEKQMAASNDFALL